MSLSLTVIVPTQGRPTLQATLDSINGHAQTLVYPNNDGNLGHPQRNKGMANATTKWLAFMDDDDTYTPDAFEIIEASLTTKPVPHIFQMRYCTENFFPEGHVLWTDPELRFANVGTPMFIVPNGKGLGYWPSKRGGDFDFITETCRNQGDPVWIPETIALIRP